MHKCVKMVQIVKTLEDQLRQIRLEKEIDFQQLIRRTEVTYSKTLNQSIYR